MARPAALRRKTTSAAFCSQQPSYSQSASLLSSLDLSTIASAKLELFSILRSAEKELAQLTPAEDADYASENDVMVQFVRQCRSYMEAITNRLDLAKISDAHSQLVSSSKALINDLYAEKTFSPVTALVAMLQRAHEILSQLAASSEESHEATLAPSPTLASRILASLPEPPSLPSPAESLAYLQSESSRLAQRVEETGRRIRRPTLTGLAEIAGQAGERIVHEGTRLKDALVEETERFAGVLSHEVDVFKAALKAGTERLLHFEELPENWKNNPFILSGYRFIPLRRWPHLLGSLFTWHNETLNMYTHIAGIASLVWLLYSWHPVSPQALSDNPSDSLVTLGFVFCAFACLLFSTTWHLMAGCSDFHAFKGAACLDYTGVSALICSSVFALIYYGFYCEKELFRIYGSAIAISGVCGLIFPWQEWFDQRKNKGWRIAFFLSLAATAVVPQIHLSFLFGFNKVFSFYLLTLASAVAYVVGLVFYAANIPECLRPGGLFDTFAHSHQFWHICIVIAIWIQYYALTVMHVEATQGFSCAAPQPSLFESVQDFVRQHVDL